MHVGLAVLSVACVSWIVTKEALFESLREATKESAWLYPLRCPYCLCPWVTALIWFAYGLPMIWFLPVVWLAYHSLVLFGTLRNL